MHRYPIEHTGLFLAFLLLWPTRAVAEWEIVNPRVYERRGAPERCEVWTRINTQAILNGEDNTEDHTLICTGERFQFSFYFSDKDNFRVSLDGPGYGEHEGETIAVAIRIDDAPTIRREVARNGGPNSINEPALAYTLLDLLATGNRAVIGVGEKSGLIPLTPHVNTAARDFRSRLPREE